MKKPAEIILFVYLALIAFCATASHALEKSIMLTVKPADDFFFENAQDGEDASVNSNSDQRIVVGLVNEPSFEIKNTANLALYDSGGKWIPLIIDKSSFYSEFDDSTINSMRVAFITDDQSINKGSFRLEWGENIEASNNVVDSIQIYSKNRDNYRVFAWESQPQKNDLANYSATLDVIVDDKADTYYIWYLLPIALIFAMLTVRKVFLT